MSFFHGSSCFIQDLSSDLDKLSPRYIKCVFLSILELRKDTGATVLPTGSILCRRCHFFESVLYFSLQSLVTASESIPLSPSVLLPALAPVLDVSSLVSPEDTTTSPVPQLLRDFRYVYTHRQKVPASESVPTDFSSPVEGPPPQLPAPSFDLDVPLALRKGNPVLIILFFNLFLRNHLNPFLVSLPFSCLLYHT